MRNACNMSVLYRLQFCVFSMFLFLHQAQNRKLGNHVRAPVRLSADQPDSDALLNKTIPAGAQKSRGAASGDTNGL